MEQNPRRNHNYFHFIGYGDGFATVNVVNNYSRFNECELPINAEYGSVMFNESYLLEAGYTFVNISDVFKLRGVTPEVHTGKVYSNALQ